MGKMVYSLVLVMQDLCHQPYKALDCNTCIEKSVGSVRCSALPHHAPLDLIGCHGKKLIARPRVSITTDLITSTTGGTQFSCSTTLSWPTMYGPFSLITCTTRLLAFTLRTTSWGNYVKI